MKKRWMPPPMTRAQVREVDRRATDEFGIPGIVLMENAGANAAAIMLERRTRSGPVAVVCGAGNNGGDGFVIARHLANAGSDVRVYLACDPPRLEGDAATNYAIIERMGLRRTVFFEPDAIDAYSVELAAADLVVDAVLGTGFSGEVRSPIDQVLDAINAADRAMVVAIDVPSGLECDTGQPCSATVRANVTITFVARKIGFDAPGAKVYTGEVIVADIGAPTDLIRRIARGDPSTL